MRFSVEKDINIDIPSAEVYHLITDLKRWPDWSPWTVGRNHLVKFSWSENGNLFAWEDEVVGSGSIEKVKDTPSEIHLELLFKKPFKSSAKVHFTITDIAKNRCNVTWRMDGNLPWFMFFRIPTMKGALSLDFWNGLVMLKYLADTGSINVTYSDVSFENFDTLHVVGKITKDCPLYAVASIQPDFTTLSSKIKSYGSHSHAINTYHHFNIKKHTLDVTAGYIVSEETFHKMKQDNSREYDFLIIDKGRAAKLTYTGTYRFIANAWSIAERFLRYKKYKPHPSLTGFEIYYTHPLNETDENKYKTDIFFATKSS